MECCDSATISLSSKHCSGESGILYFHKNFGINFSSSTENFIGILMGFVFNLPLAGWQSSQCLLSLEPGSPGKCPLQFLL